MKETGIRQVVVLSPVSVGWFYHPFQWVGFITRFSGLVLSPCWGGAITPFFLGGGG